jgi:hypothetical protein
MQNAVLSGPNSIDFGLGAPDYGAYVLGDASAANFSCVDEHLNSQRNIGITTRPLHMAP